MPLAAAGDADAYRADPVGRYLGLPRALAFCAHEKLWGFALWGDLKEADMRRLVPLLALELESEIVPHASLVHAGHLESSDPRAFALLARYLRTNVRAFRTRITRLALVRPGGQLGAAVAGFPEVAGTPYPVRVFEELRPAVAWLRGGALAAELDAAIAIASAVPPVVMELRQWLATHLADATLARAARTLSRAPRSLQRDLRLVRSSFQHELDVARVRLAQRLMVDTDSPLTEIAYDVGCASPQHFSTLFRRVARVTPSTWRRKAPATGR